MQDANGPTSDQARRPGADSKLRLDLLRIADEGTLDFGGCNISSPHASLATQSAAAETRMLSPAASSYVSKHLARQMALGKSPRPAARPDQPTQPDTRPAEMDQGTQQAFTASTAETGMAPRQAPGTQPSNSAAASSSSTFVVPKLFEDTAPSSTGQHSSSSAQASSGSKTARAGPSMLQRKGQHPVGMASTSSLFTSSGPEAFRNLSDSTTPSAAALDRKEQLKQYLAQKAARAAAGGTGALVAGGGSDVVPAATRRFSSGPARVATRPPMPSAQPSRPAALNTVAAINHAATLPLPPGDEGLLEGPPSPVSKATTAAEPQPVQRTRPSQAHELITAKAPLALHGRFSLGGVGSAAAPTSRGTGSASSSGLYVPRSIAPGSGGGSLPTSFGGAGPSAGSVSHAGVAGQGSGDVRAEIRALRLQELQWRYINARMEQALESRKQQGEHALAACVLATSQLERSTAEATAQQNRQLQQQRAVEAAQALQPLLQPFMQLQAQTGSPDSVLQHVAQGLVHSLTRIPLVAGAVCGDTKEADLEALEQAMTRGLDVLMHIDSCMQPLMATTSEDLGAAADSHMAVDGSTEPASNRVAIPTATILTQLVTHLKGEVSALGTVRQLMDLLRSKQLQLNSYQAQLVQMARRQQQTQQAQA